MYQETALFTRYYVGGINFVVALTPVLNPICMRGAFGRRRGLVRAGANAEGTCDSHETLDTELWKLVTASAITTSATTPCNNILIVWVAFSPFA